MNINTCNTCSLIFVIDAFTRGGAQRNLQLLLLELVNRGFSVKLILLQDSKYELDLEKLIARGINVHRVSASSLTNFAAFISFYRAIGKSNNVVISNLYWSQIWSALATFMIKGLRVFWVEHNTYINRTSIQWFFFKILSKRIVALLTVSQEIERYVRTKCKSPTKVINNMAISHFERFEVSLKVPIFLFVGRLVNQKNPILSLEAFSYALDNKLIPRRSKLLIIGTGELEDSLQSFVSSRGLRESVNFLGFMEPLKLSRIMSSSHVLLMSSLHEGSPLVRLEALVNGMTIVTTKTSGIEDILTFQGSTNLLPGIFISDSKIESLAQNLALAIKPNCWTNQAINIRLESSRRFYPSNVAESLINYIAN
jgi:glycosyltransferase involved in cell wall biosynthesis